MPKTLLLADDSVTIQKVVGLSFANEDVSLLTVDNGDDAIAQARAARPDVILADVVMPGKNGYEVCEAIKGDPQLRHIPVLLLTGTFEAFDDERARRAGADGHITKPFEAQALVDTVNGLLARAEKAARAAAAERAAAAPPAPIAAQPAPVAAQPAPPAARTVAPAPPPAAPVEISTSPGGSSVPLQEEAYDFFDDELMAEGELSLADEGTEAAARGAAEGTVLLGQRDDAPFDLGEGDSGLELGEPEDAIDLSTAFSEAPTAPPTRPLAPAQAPAPAPRSAPEATVALFADAADEPFAGASAPASFEDDLDALDPETALGESTGSGASATVALFDDEPMALGRATSAPANAGTPDDGLELSFEEPAGRRAGRNAGDDPLARLDPDDLARETVLDPASARGHDVSWSDLGDPLRGSALGDPLRGSDLGDPLRGSDLGDPLGGPSFGEPRAAADPGASLRGTSRGDHTPTAPARAPEPAPVFAPTPVRPAPPAPAPAPIAARPTAPITPTAPIVPIAPAPTAGAPARSAGPDISPVMRQRIHDTLEKVAWEAFSDLSDTIVRQALERIEAIAWEVIPQMAEALVREEIRRMKGEDE